MKNKRLTYLITIVCILLLFGWGCAAKKNRNDSLVFKTDGNDRFFIFPDGSMLESASAAQAYKLAEIFTFSHNQMMKEISDLKRQLKGFPNQGDLFERTMNKIEERSLQRIEKYQQSSEKALAMIKALSTQQGAGEITIFFATGRSTLRVNSMQYQRLVRFLDYVARESRGRKILFVSIGCASYMGGNSRINKKLAEQRAAFPIKVIDKYNVNTPHEFFMTYGVVEEKTDGLATASNNDHHLRYQHARIIAVYDADQLPELPKISSQQKHTSMAFDEG